MAWVFIVVAGMLETAMAIALKESHAFSRHAWTAAFLVLAVASFSLLSLGLRDVPVGTAYAVWTGIGAAGTAVAGMLLLGEPREAGRLMAIGLIISGVIALKVLGGD